jgi:hypothetical protein
VARHTGLTFSHRLLVLVFGAVWGALLALNGAELVILRHWGVGMGWVYWQWDPLFFLSRFFWHSVLGLEPGLPRLYRISKVWLPLAMLTAFVWLTRSWPR